MPNTAHPHKTHKELFTKVYDLAKQNRFQKQLSEEIKNKLTELDDKPIGLKNEGDSQKGTSSQLIGERHAIISEYSSVLDIHKDPSAIALFKDLETTLDKRIVQEIKETKKRCILILGTELDLIQGVASYIYFHNTHKKFYPVECLGLNEDEIVNRLKEAVFEKDTENMPYEEYKAWVKAGKPKESAIEKYKSGCTLFLRGVKSTEIFERLTGIVRSEKTDGLLIVSAPNMDNVPGEFLYLCETIYLQTTLSFDDEALTVIVNDETFDDLQDYEYKLFKLLYNEKDAFVSFPAIKATAFTHNTSNALIMNKVSALNKKFKKYFRITNKRGVGYKISTS